MAHQLENLWPTKEIQSKVTMKCHKLWKRLKMVIIPGWLVLEAQTPQCMTNSSLYHVAVLEKDCGFLIS